MLLNGRPLEKTVLNHKDIMNGGVLEFRMTNNPSAWGSYDGDTPVTEISDHLIVPTPFISKGEVAFKEQTSIELNTVDSDSKLFYSLNSEAFQAYEKPIVINEAAELSVYAKRGDATSKIITTKFYKIDPNLTITLDSKYANQYNAGGNDALIDGIFGTEDFRTGTWQGYWNEDLIATVDLGRLKPINEISVGFLQDQRSWIFYPTDVQCLVSKDGITFKSIASTGGTFSLEKKEEVEIKRALFPLNSTADYRYVKIVAKKLGRLPEWHLGYEHDGRSWIFADEISIK